MESPNPCEVGINGVIVDETMKTLRIETPKGIKTVAKKGRIFAVEVDGIMFKVSGDLITFRPEERIMRGIMLINRIKGD
uniref:Ribonuclease P protein subunit n=1 Tax=Geoglobus ahangari TaxID=113653 RepID=A0A7C4WET5_9EURY